MSSDIFYILPRLIPSFFRTINSEFDQTNFSVIPSLGTVSLSIQCAELVSHRSRLDNGSFHHLGQLEDLSIKYCKLSQLPTGGLAGLDRLVNLTIQTFPQPDQPLSLTVETGSLAGLAQLRSLSLSHSGVWQLPGGELCGVTSLTRLNLSHNAVKDISDLGMVGQHHCRLMSLASLDLSFNDLREIARDSFSAAANLKLLLLANNQISQVHDGALNGLSDLKTLDLSGN